jgi:hypothetical protein
VSKDFWRLRPPKKTGVKSTDESHLDQSQKDRSWASQTPGRNVRLIHNRLFSEPVRCCDVANLYQAFSQPTGPGRLWISLDALLLQYQIDPLINQTNPTQSRSKQPKTVT